MSQVHNSSAQYEVPAETKYKVYPYRYYMLGLFLFGVLLNATATLIFSPLQTQLEEIYGISLSEVTLGTSLISNLLYAPACLLCNWMIDQFGFRRSIIFASCFLSLGFWIRTFCNVSFWFVKLGQATVAWAQPFLSATGARFSAIWFPPNERTFITTLIFAVLPLGNALGVMIPAIMVDSTTRGSTAFSEITFMLEVMAFLSTIMTLAVIFTFKEKPETPPSPAALAVKYNLRKSLIEVWTNKNLILIIVFCSIYKGTCDGLASVAQPIEKPLGLTPVQTAEIFAVTIVLCFISSIIACAIVSKTKKFRTVILSFTSIGTATMYLIPIFGRDVSIPVLSILAIIPFVFAVASVPLMYELIGGLAFPVSEALPGTLLLFGINYTGIPIGLGIDQIVQAQTPAASQMAFFLVCGVLTIANFFMWFMKEDLRRMKFEKNELAKPLNSEGLLEDLAETQN